MKSKETFIKNSAMICLFILLTISASFIIYGQCGNHFNSIESLRTYVASYGIWAPLILALIQTMLVILPLFPSFMGCIAGALLFGPIGGFLINYIGICSGSIIAYWLAKHFGIQLVNQMIPLSRYDSYIKRINRSKSYSTVLFFSILLPLAPDNFLCYFSGLINMSSRKFFTIIILGKPWCILLYSIFFSYFI